MKIQFLGTRGGIIARSKEHYSHSSILIEYYSSIIRIDYGLDWLNVPLSIIPDALFITHAHKDHVGGLQDGIDCPVFATEATWSKIKRYRVKEKKIIIPRKPIFIGEIKVEAFEVEHSINAPAVGYRITAGKNSIFYVPDLIEIKQKKEALTGVKYYIGDGAVIKSRFLMRKRDSITIGHVPVVDQVKWCHETHVPNFVVTHCGSEITKADIKITESKLQKIANEFNVNVILAYDGLVINV